MLWALLAAMSVIAAALVAWPLWRARRAAPAPAPELAVHRDRLAEIAAEQNQGLISAAEAEAARAEIGRQALRASEAVPSATPAPQRARALAVALAVAVPLLAIALYVRLGTPDYAARMMPPEMAEIADLLVQVEARVAAAPKDPEGWIALGRGYGLLGRFKDAAEAYARAARLRPEDPALHGAEGQARVLAAGGRVTEAARAAFAAAAKRDPADPAARYHLALAEFQRGNVQAAYDGWAALADDIPPEAPWAGMLQARLDEAAARLGREAPRLARPQPSAVDMAAAAQMAPEQRQAMIRGMVERLAARLAANPEDREGWLRLGRSYEVLGEQGQAVSAYEKALALAPNEPETLAALGMAVAAAGDRPRAQALLGQARDALPANDPRRAELAALLAQVATPDE